MKPRVGLGVFVLFASVSPVAAQVAAVDFGTGSFTQVTGPVTVTQTMPQDNVVGIAQTGPSPMADVTQTGFYNRAVIVQIDNTNPNQATVLQNGDFSRAIVIQVGPANTDMITQNGAKSTAIVDQSASSGLSGLSPAMLQGLVTNLLYAPETAAAESRLGRIGAAGLAASLFSELDTQGGRACALPPAPGGAPAGTIAFDCRLSVFADGHGQHGDQAYTLGSTGYRYDSGAFTGGADYRITPDLSVGPLVNYTHTGADLRQGLGTIDVDSFQVGAFGSFARQAFFAQVVAAYGFNAFAISRPGFTARVKASPSGDSFVAAVKAGYLFDVGRMQIGPIGGLTYTNASVDGYTESGDILLAQSVGTQSADDLVADAGIRLKMPFGFGGSTILPYVDLTAEHDSPLQSLKTLTTSFLLEPGQFLTPVQYKAETYGKVVGGIGWDLTRTVRIGVTGEGTFARASGDSLAFDAGLRIGF